MADHLSPAHDPTPRPQSQNSVASLLDESERISNPRRVLPTGFSTIDRVIDGGIHTRNLTVLAGVPGAGKTIATLQWARNMARAGHRAVFVCYEHDQSTLLTRLMRLELGELPAETRLGQQALQAKEELKRFAAGETSMSEAVTKADLLAQPYEAIRTYADRLWLVTASGTSTDLDALAGFADGHTDALFVDYIQKVPLQNGQSRESERLVSIAQGLKEIAMTSNVAVVAIAASTRDGLQAPRLRLHHLRGSSALAYEADVVMVMNNKFDIVSRTQMTHDMQNVERFKNQVVFSLDKNRNGDDGVDIEFDKQFEYLRIDPNGATVQERLIDDRLFTE